MAFPTHSQGPRWRFVSLQEDPVHLPAGEEHVSSFPHPRSGPEHHGLHLAHRRAAAGSSGEGLNCMNERGERLLIDLSVQSLMRGDTNHLISRRWLKSGSLRRPRRSFWITPGDATRPWMTRHMPRSKP